MDQGFNECLSNIRGLSILAGFIKKKLDLIVKVMSANGLLECFSSPLVVTQEIDTIDVSNLITTATLLMVHRIQELGMAAAAGHSPVVTEEEPTESKKQMKVLQPVF